MSAWANLVVNLAYVLLGAVLGVGATKGLQASRLRTLRDALSPQERAAVAAQLARRGASAEATLLSGSSPLPAGPQAALLEALSPEERAAVAARLAAASPALPGSLSGWSSEPPARAIISSREASRRLRGQAQAGNPPAVPTVTGSAEPAAWPAQETGAMQAAPAPGVDYAALLALWQTAAAAFDAWVRSPSEDWLRVMEAEGGPEAALCALEAALPQLEPGPAGAAVPVQSRFLSELRDELALARLVLLHTRGALAPGSGARARSIQIANAAQYALREMPAAGQLLAKLSFEEKLGALG
jgi:hypothetical protein